MEALGAIGLARVFHIGGRIGADLFHPDDPSAKAGRSMIWPTRSTISARKSSRCPIG